MVWAPSMSTTFYDGVSRCQRSRPLPSRPRPPVLSARPECNRLGWLPDVGVVLCTILSTHGFFIFYFLYLDVRHGPIATLQGGVAALRCSSPPPNLIYRNRRRSRCQAERHKGLWQAGWWRGSGLIGVSNSELHPMAPNVLVTCLSVGGILMKGSRQRPVPL